MKPALAQVSTLKAPFETDIADYAAGQCRAIEIWLGKLESYLETHTVEHVCQLLQEHGVIAPVASYQGGLLSSQGDARKEHWNHFAQRLELCRQLAIETLVITADIAGQVTQQDINRVGMSLKQAARQAQDHHVRLALEFQSQAVFCNNLQTAMALIQDTASPNLGICLDVFHYFTGPSKSEDLHHLTAQNLFHVQLCDLLGQARELATDADRVLPGDGDFPLTPIVDHLRAMGYQGSISIELMNPQIWQIAPLSFGEIGMTALRKVLGQSSMGGRECE